MKHYKLHLCFLLCLLSTLNLAGASTNSPSVNELVFLTWPEYIDPDIVREFETEHNAKIRFVYFQSDDNRDQLVLDANGSGFDIAILNGLKVNTYAKRGWLAPLTQAQIPNLKHVDNKWLHFFEAAEKYTSPYLWGTIGIAYREDLVPEPITQWKQLFRPHEKLRGKIVMIDSQREVIGLALKTLGYSINSHNLSEIKQAETLVNQQKPFVKGYSYISITETSSLVTGHTYAAYAYSGDALSIMAFEPRVKYVLPEEGSIVWVDYLSVFERSTNKQLAYTFLNFLQQPEIATRLALYTNYATTNISAQPLLPKLFIDNKTIYPDTRALSKSEADEELPARVAKEYARIMTNLIE